MALQHLFQANLELGLSERDGPDLQIPRLVRRARGEESAAALFGGWHATWWKVTHLPSGLMSTLVI
jgi:hypothetical protein